MHADPSGFRRILFVLTAIAAVSVLPAAQTEAVKPPRWVILVYGHADHNLSPSLVADLAEMSAEGSGERFTIVVQTDFDASEADSLEEDGLPEGLAVGGARMRILKAKEGENITVDVLEKLPEPDMDKPETLSAFLSWALETFPADRRGLVLWDHGGQWKGYGGDTQDGTREETGEILPAEVREALRKAMKGAGLEKWDFIGYDSCLMGGVEVLESVIGLTDVFIACPEIDFGDGWDYAAFFRALKQRPDAPPREIGVLEADTWKAQHLTDANPDDQVLAGHAVYDMTAWPGFEKALEGFTTALAEVGGDGLLALAAARLRATEYDISGMEDLGEPSEFVDVAAFARLASQAPGIPDSVVKASAGLEKAVNALVVRKVLGAAHSGGGGLSVWYPRTGKPYDFSELDADGDEADDDRAVRDVIAVAEEDFRKYQGGGLRVRAHWGGHLARVSESFLANADEELEIEDPAADPEEVLPLRPGESVSLPVRVIQGKAVWRLSASIVDTAFSPKDYEVTYLGEIASVPAAGPGLYTPRWDGRLPALVAGGRRAWLGTVTLVEGEQPVLVSNARYYAPRSRKGVDALLLTHVIGGKARLVGVLEAGDEETAPSALDVEPGGSLQPVYVTERRKGDDPDKWKVRITPAKERFTIPPEGLNGMNVTFDRVPPGTYYVDLQAEDVYGDTSEVVEKEVNVLEKDKPAD